MGPILIPRQLLCTRKSALKVSRALAHKLLFLQGDDHLDLELMDPNSVDAQIVFTKNTVRLMDSDPEEDVFFLPFVYGSAVNEYERAIVADEPFDDDAWGMRMRTFVKQNIQYPWFCLSLLGSQLSPYLPLKRREDDQYLHLEVARHLVQAVKLLLELEKKGKVVEDLWSSAVSTRWFVQWGLSLIDIARSSERTLAQHPLALKQLDPHEVLRQLEISLA